MGPRDYLCSGIVSWLVVDQSWIVVLAGDNLFGAEYQFVVACEGIHATVS
jgi:hypothetical protein